MFEFLVFFVIFWAAFILGFFTKSWIDSRFRDYSGTIVVDRIRDKTVYSLVLDEYPEKLEFKKVVILKVDVPEKDS